jgi:hypothetical protein
MVGYFQRRKMRESNRMRVRYTDTKSEYPPFTRHVLGPLTVLCEPIVEGCHCKLLAITPGELAVSLFDKSAACGDVNCEVCDKKEHTGKMFNGLRQGDIIVCCNAILEDDDNATNCFFILDSAYLIIDGIAKSLGGLE